MTECVVICAQCVDDTTGRPKRWDWLCETCAENCLDEHRRHTGHTDLELRVVQEFTADDLNTRAQRRLAARLTRREGWAG